MINPKNKFKAPEITWFPCKSDPDLDAVSACSSGSSELDLSNHGLSTCQFKLPQKTKMGYFKVNCLACNRLTIVDVNGRNDDPKTVKVACNTN